MEETSLCPVYLARRYLLGSLRTVNKVGSNELVYLAGRGKEREGGRGEREKRPRDSKPVLSTYRLNCATTLNVLSPCTHPTLRERGRQGKRSRRLSIKLKIDCWSNTLQRDRQDLVGTTAARNGPLIEAVSKHEGARKEGRIETASRSMPRRRGRDGRR